jgi:cephalosporin hydroxylase
MNQNPYEIGLLYNFLQGKMIKDILEIGTQNGGTALLWAKLAESRGGHVVSIDHAPETPKVYENHVLKDMIIQIGGDSHNQETIDKVHEVISSNGRKVDFLFIDGDHTYQGVKADFAAYSGLVKEGGWIAFHDILDTEWHRGQNCLVSDFWSEIKEKYNHIEIIDPNDKRWMGIGLIEWKPDIIQSS